MKLIIGAGIYGLYSALFLGSHCSDEVVVLEYESKPFKRATYINQARVHMGYHYPRSLYTAKKSANYFNRFVKDYGFSIYKDFKQIYATSADFSWTNANEFAKFCKNSSIECERVDISRYFNSGMCDGAFSTQEYTYDADILLNHFLEQIAKYQNIKIFFDSRIENVVMKSNSVTVETNNGNFTTDFVLNSTYASTNEISKLFGLSTFEIKYELCEIILCDVSNKLKDVGITVMDGPFFSIMPFGKTGYHSLTSVTFTPHVTSYNELPCFECQTGMEDYCSPDCLGNCNECKNKPHTSWPYMSKLARKYLKEEYGFNYVKSLYSIKPILKASEVDDSRPTVIRKLSDEPLIVSVLSGKINTVYDLDDSNFALEKVL